MISAEPAVRVRAMAELAAKHPDLTAALCDADLPAIRAAIGRVPDFARLYGEYLEKFGDRCLEELKLETETLADDPTLLVRSVGRLARTPNAPRGERVDVRAAAKARAREALRGHPVRRTLFWWALRRARARVRDRENLRFERTRVFGRVRRIFLELGRRYFALGALDDPRDVFHLTVDEILGWPDATTPSADLRAIAAARAAEFARWRASPAPPGRFETRGPVHVVRDLIAPRAAASMESLGGESRRGTGCYPGVVRGRVRVVRDPREAVMEPGEILVAERTDPGWVMLFPAARALLVERGSLLSHSAIVARELGLPAVIAIDGLTAWLRTGDEVELDGRTGVVRRLGSAEAA